MRMAAWKSFRKLKCDRGIAALEFVMLAPALLLLVFSIIVYSIYFSAAIGVRQAAAEGARAAVAGLSQSERSALALKRAGDVIEDFRSVLSGPKPTVTAGPGAETGTFQVRVSYDMTGSPISKYVDFIPLPSETVTASVTVTNGGY